MQDGLSDLENGIVLAELGGYGNGPFCAEYGKGAALVIMGTYIIDASDDVRYPAEFVFKPGPSNYRDYLRRHVPKAKESGAKVAVSAISVNLQDTVDFLVEAEAAGADYVSLCGHSAMDMFTSRGLGYKICMPENRLILKEWARVIMDATKVPFIFKPGSVWKSEIIESVRIVAGLGGPILHANLGLAFEPQGLETVKKLSSIFDFVIAGGGITNANSAGKVLAAGAKAVSVAKAAMQDSTFIGRLRADLQAAES